MRHGELDTIGPPARRPVCGELDNGPSAHRSPSTSSPWGPEPAAPLAEQGHLRLGCDEGPEVGRPPGHVREPEAITGSLRGSRGRAAPAPAQHVR